jgi:hypothetical protein
MTTPPRPSRTASSARTLVAATLLSGLVVTGCVLAPSPTPTPRASEPPTSRAPETPPASVAASPTATPEPEFALALPDERDPRRVSVTIEPDLDGGGGELLVTLTSGADERIDEIVLRWATELDEMLFLAPFVPTPERIQDGGPPLVQEWTKWVVGPGERDEPAGTTSLGYGPLLAGATLAIPIAVERRADDPVAFDLQLLAGNALLQLDDGSPAVVRVEIP